MVILRLRTIPLAMNRQIERRITTNRVLLPMIALMLAIPFWASMLALVFGSILGVIEGWPTKDGILLSFPINLDWEPPLLMSFQPPWAVI